MDRTKTRTGAWRTAAAVLAVAGLVSIADAQQGQRRGGGGKGNQPAAAQKQNSRPAQPRAQQKQKQQQNARPAQQAAPRQQQGQRQQPAAASRQTNQPQRQAASPPPQVRATPRAAPQAGPAPVVRAAPAASGGVQRHTAAPPAPMPAAPRVAPRVTSAPVFRAAPNAPRPSAAPPSPIPAAPKAADRAAPVVRAAPSAPRPTAAPPSPIPAAPKAAPRSEPKSPGTPGAKPSPQVSKPEKKATPPAVTRPAAPKVQLGPAQQPGRLDRKPSAPDVRPTPSGPKANPGAGSKGTPPAIVLPKPRAAAPSPPVVIAPKADAPKRGLERPAAPAPTVKPPVVTNRAGPARIVSSAEPTNGLVRARPTATPERAAPIEATPRPRVDGGSSADRPRVTASRGQSRQASAGQSAGFTEGLTFDSGLDRSNGLVRSFTGEQFERGRDRDWDRGWRDGRRHRGYGGYGHFDYGYQTWVTYPPHRPFYTSAFHGYPLYTSTIYSYSPYSYWSTYYTPCPPTYVYHAPARYSYACPPVYTYGYGHWGYGSRFSFGFRSGRSFFSFGFGSRWPCYDPCYDPCASWCAPVYRYDPCPPSFWWRRPVWGWSTWGCDPWSSAAPLSPVGEFGDPTIEYDFAQLDAAEEFDDAVYRTMRGDYATAIQTTRDAVLGSSESFAPGATEMDREQLQRATWALTVYRNPPRRAVDEKDAAFMVAAIAAISGDRDSATAAAGQARELGDDHPATERLIEMLALEQGAADWGIQAAAR